MGTAEGGRGIEHELESAPLRDLSKALHGAGPTPNMGAEDRRGAGCDMPLDPGRVKVVRGRINIGKNRRDLLPLERVRGGDERVGWNNHFALEPGGADGDLEADGGVA